jgi:glycerol kinase
MNQDAKYSLKELRVDGGAAANDLLMQFQADLLGIPVQRPAVLETTALGAAYLAGLASGFWPDIETIAKNRVKGATFTPNADRAVMNKLRAKWRDAVERSKGWYRETV